MIFSYHKQFKKHFKLRIQPFPSLLQIYTERLKLFVHNPQNPILKDHVLKGGMGGYRAFAITGDIRVIYAIEENTIRFYDIGSHNQVYR